jgi:anaerobilin synthase
MSGSIPRSNDFSNPYEIFETLDTTVVKSRALYLHIPFCKYICTFCPFTRSLLKDDQSLEIYTRALIQEINLKAAYEAIHKIPIAAIFIGGGTPSVLTPDQIQRIGAAIHDNYDLSRMSEFSVEMAVASITPEKLEEFRDIGVTNARFGVQTFDPKYRSLFNLPEDIDLIYSAAEALPQYFPHTSFDIMYGFNGQTDDEFISDIQAAISLGINNIDFYPINNVVIQSRLHKAYADAGLQPTTGFRKFTMNILLRQFMEAAGYLPHNGHGYVKVSSQDIHRHRHVTDKYTFQYHEHVYGYQDTEVLGFGVGAISSLNRYTMRNVLSWKHYVDALSNGILKFTVAEHDPSMDASKGIIGHLPYHGDAEKNHINWDLVHHDTLYALENLLSTGLVIERPDRFELTQEGWYWYTNLMYYLSPIFEKQAIDYFINKTYAAPEPLIEISNMPIRD